MNEYYDLMFNQDVVHIGETFARSRLVRTPIAELNDNADLWTHYIYTLLADPEMSMWTSTLQDLNVTHVSSVGLGTNSIQIDVDAVGGGSVEGALVCLSKGTDDYRYGTTNSSGRVTFDFRAESAGDAVRRDDFGDGAGGRVREPGRDDGRRRRHGRYGR
jgi:hypothetical protein